MISSCWTGRVGSPSNKQGFRCIAKTCETIHQNGWELIDTKESDEHGHTNISASGAYFLYRFLIESGKDRIRIMDRIWLENTANYDDLTEVSDFEKMNQHLNFFTDRSIYRPGQTLYFKGIATTVDRISKNSKILPGKSIKIFLHDAASKIIDSLTLITNEYGSLNGKFLIPQQVMTGNFSLRTNVTTRFYGYQNIQVEAYKRPTYSIQFDRIQKAYQINDSVQVSGVVKAFAGNTIDAANLVYQIHRNARPIYHSKRYLGFQYSPEQELASGKLITDPTGKFTIRFKASGDDRPDRYADQIFDFNIVATVTDRNGETKTGRTSISCGQQLLQLAVYHPEQINSAADEKMIISCLNLNNVLQAAKVKVRIIALNGPERVIRAREWQRPDQFTMSKENYLKWFPYDEYDHEAAREELTANRIVLEDDIQTDTIQPQSSSFQKNCSAQGSIKSLPVPGMHSEI